MKIVSLLIGFAFLYLTACQKTNTEINTNHPPVDSTKTGNSDTATLLKSAVSYSYDVSGTNITDSVRYLWSYDDKHRAVMLVTTIYSANIVDTIFTSYGANTKTERTVSYISGALNWDNTNITYFNASAKPDSMIGISHRYDGSPSPQNSYFYYHYNDQGQDILETSYSIVNNAMTNFSKTRYTYTNNLLDSNIFYFGDTTVVADVRTYSNGNLARELHYQDGSVWADVTFTYYDTPTGVLNSYLGGPYITKSIAQVYPGSPGDNRTDGFTYTLDEKGRVNSMTRTSQNVTTSKDFFTYF